VPVLLGILCLVASFAALGCKAKEQPAQSPAKPSVEELAPPPRSLANPEIPTVEQPTPPWAEEPVLDDGQVFALRPDGAVVADAEAEEADGRLIVDLGNSWVPFILSERDRDPRDPEPNSERTGARRASKTPAEDKPNPYRDIFIRLANDEVNNDILYLRGEGPTRALPNHPEGLSRQELEAFEEAQAIRRERLIGRLSKKPIANHLEVYGIPPTLGVLRKRIEADLENSGCYEAVDKGALAAFADQYVTYTSFKKSAFAFNQSQADNQWLLETLRAFMPALAAQGIWEGGLGSETELAGLIAFGSLPPVAPEGDEVGAPAAADIKPSAKAAVKAAVEPASESGSEEGVSDPASTPEVQWTAEALALAPAEYNSGEARLALLDRLARQQSGVLRVAAVKAAQARLRCEGLIKPSDSLTPGSFDLTTHKALAEWEKKNNIFSWGILGGDTLAALQISPLDLHLETFARIVTARVADAASIVEDESLAEFDPPVYVDADGNTRRIRNLVAEFRETVVAGLGIATADDLVAFIRATGPEGLSDLRVSIDPPPLPPYYDGMIVEVEIDRGDVWYDFPFRDDGKARPQPRGRFPQLTVFARWRGQKIPLVRWRTTIGSWRSEKHPDGNVYYRYKNSDVGERIWKHIVAAPVWVPPDSTPGKGLLKLKKFEEQRAPEVVINTDIMGPGYQSAYGLVMAIHHEVRPGGTLFDNQIRTHGSVDYTSIARRYSHGCHRLVNISAVRLFGFILAHTPYQRMGNKRLGFRKTFQNNGQEYSYQLDSRGYYYRLRRPVKVNVLEGRLRGKLEKPITAFVRKPGVDYEALEAAEAPELGAIGDESQNADAQAVDDREEAQWDALESPFELVVAELAAAPEPAAQSERGDSAPEDSLNSPDTAVDNSSDGEADDASAFEAVPEVAPATALPPVIDPRDARERARGLPSR